MGVPTGKITQYNKPVYQNEDGEYSEKSITINVDGKWVNVPTVFNGTIINDENVLRNAIKNKVIKPTSVHNNLAEAVQAAQERSDNMSTQSPAQETIDVLKRVGFSDSSIPAIMGNIEVETGDTFDFKQKQKNGSGYGLFQFDYMKPAYKNYLKEKGLTDSKDSQAHFIYDALYAEDPFYDVGHGNRKKMIKSFKEDDLDTMTEKFSKLILRPSKPHMERRKVGSRHYIVDTFGSL